MKRLVLALALIGVTAVVTHHHHHSRRPTQAFIIPVHTLDRASRGEVRTSLRRLVATPTSDLNWPALAQCESGGNPRTNTGNGFYGAYQFDAGTWASVGGHGLPSDNSLAEQTYRARLLYAQRGREPWPVCGHRL